MFPEEVPRRLIKMFSFVGDCVLDPFLGSGTTCLAARNLARNSIGYEINPEFTGIIRRKLGIKGRSVVGDARFEFMEQDPLDIDPAEIVCELPYIFRDPVQFAKKVDPRTLQFGSRVSLSK
jgi:site-specific DNA-methyltransferase (adenine-specific)